MCCTCFLVFCVLVEVGYRDDFFVSAWVLAEEELVFCLRVEQEDVVSAFVVVPYVDRYVQRPLVSGYTNSGAFHYPSRSAR